jgi:hypothetical protein
MTASVTPSKGGTMLRKLVTFGAVTGATLVLAGSAGWGATPIRDAGDATATTDDGSKGSLLTVRYQR